MSTSPTELAITDGALPPLGPAPDPASAPATDQDVPAQRRIERSERADLSADLLERAARAVLEGDTTEHSRLLDEVVILNMPVAKAMVSRYRNRGIAEEDLLQVAYLALVKAARGYDTSTGNPFLSYAVPTIRGEVKRYFRDHGWAVRPPRRIQELQAQISGALSELTFRLGRSPRPSEVAAHLGEDLESVTEALAADGCFTPTSLDRPATGDEGSSLGDLLGCDDEGQASAEARTVLGPLVRRLDERDRRILMLRFFEGWTQQEIADDIGVTQMQVSRLLSRILTRLREELADEPDGAV
ncbi:MAG: SigB/SigF/SigG family RNA polymerase sigma factor [Nocardioidaceae bacterium]